MKKKESNKKSLTSETTWTPRKLLAHLNSLERKSGLSETKEAEDIVTTDEIRVITIRKNQRNIKNEVPG